jgi:hypothetical protein
MAQVRHFGSELQMVLLAGGLGLLLASRRRNAGVASAALTADEQARLDKLLGG